MRQIDASGICTGASPVIMQTARRPANQRQAAEQHQGSGRPNSLTLKVNVRPSAEMVIVSPASRSRSLFVGTGYAVPARPIACG